MFCFYTYGFSWDTVLVFAVFMILFTITMIDFDTMTIPNGLIISLIVPVGIFTVLHPETALMTRAIGFFIVSLPMYLLTLLIPDCFGGGDIKLIAVEFSAGMEADTPCVFYLRTDRRKLCGISAFVKKNTKGSTYRLWTVFMCRDYDIITLW